MNTLEHVAAVYLLNSLWQVPALCATAWLLARLVRRIGPEAEHRVWVGALFAECVLPACAAPNIAAWLRHLFAARVTTDGAITVTLGLATAHDAGAAAAILRVALLLYAGVTTFFVGRFLWQCVQLRLLLRRAKPLLLKGADAAFMQACCERLQIPSVELGSAEPIRTPLTFGLRRPVLLLPEGFVERVTAAQLQTALSHELAHVARHDAAKHLLYRWVSLPLAYHPAVWFALAHIAETRERVCDRMAASQTGSARQYVHSLLELASLLTARRPAQSHAIGLFDANQFERRVLMLHRHSLPLGRPLRVAVIAASAVVATAACTTALALHFNVSPVSVLHGDLAVKAAPGVMEGQLISQVSPKYPEEAKKAKVQGSVVLAAVIGKTGTVEHLTVVSGPSELQASAIDAVRQWVYKPYLLNGQPTEVETKVEITYSIY